MPLHGRHSIRIGHILTSIAQGGLERFVLNLFEALPPDRFDIRVYSLLRDNPWLHEYERIGVPVRVFDADNRPSFASMPRNAVTVARLARALREDRIDIVHVPDFFPALLGRVASLAAGVPARVHTLHSVYDWYPRSAHRLQGILARFTDVVTAVSRPALEHSSSNTCIPASKCRLIHNGADERRFRPDAEERLRWRSGNGWTENDIVIGAVGCRSPRKGHPLLAEAAAPLMARDPRIHLAILGPTSAKDPDTSAEVESILDAAGVADRLRFLPPCSDIENAYRGFDVHCMPSSVEGMSFAAIEGILSGAVSVFSDLPAFHELVTEGRNGFLFRTGDADSLRATLLRAIEQTGDAGWVAGARDRTVEQFGLRRMADQFAALYEELVDRKGRHPLAV